MFATTQEAQQSAAAAAVSRANSHSETAADGELFSRELFARIAASTPSQDKITRTMEKLASALPGLTVTSQALTAFAEDGSYSVRTGADTTATITPDVMSAMADDQELFDKVAGMIQTLAQAGKEQDLVDSSGASSVQRNVAVSSSDIRYVEVQRGKDGTTISAASLMFEAWDEVNEALHALASGQNPAAAGPAVSSSGSTFIGALSGRGQASGGGFSRIVDFSASWRFQSYLSSESPAMQTLRAQQQRMASIDVIIQQWEAGGGRGMDFFSLMQMGGLADPIVLDLADEGINLSSAEDGVMFDLKGDGSQVKTGFPTGNNAFLYLDGNGNGVVDDGNELFGDQGGYRDGYAKLGQYDDNRDGVVDARDAVYDDLKVWRDVNGDGVNQAAESMGLAEAGVASLDLHHDSHWEYDQHGNVIGPRSAFTRTDGSKGTMADVWLRYLQG